MDYSEYVMVTDAQLIIHPQSPSTNIYHFVTFQVNIMTRILSFTIVVLLGLRLLFVYALPNVTVVALGSSRCSSWPGWIPPRDADTTGALQFQADQADDSGIDDLYTTYRSFN